MAKKPWQSLSGPQKTRLQEVALFLSEQEKLHSSSNPDDFLRSQMRRMAHIRHSQLEKQTAQQIQQEITQSFQKYTSEKEFTSLETVRKMLKVEPKLITIKKPKQTLQLSKTDPIEKTLERKLDTAPDTQRKEQRKKEVELAHLQTAIINSWQQGYELDIEEKKQEKKYY